MSKFLLKLLWLRQGSSRERDDSSRSLLCNQKMASHWISILHKKGTHRLLILAHFRKENQFRIEQQRLLQTPPSFKQEREELNKRIEFLSQQNQQIYRDSLLQVLAFLHISNEITHSNVFWIESLIKFFFLEMKRFNLFNKNYQSEIMKLKRWKIKSRLMNKN